MDIAEFTELVDAYQCAQKDGTLTQRACARMALINAFREARRTVSGQEDKREE